MLPVTPDCHDPFESRCAGCMGAILQGVDEGPEGGARRWTEGQATAAPAAGTSASPHPDAATSSATPGPRLVRACHINLP